MFVYRLVFALGRRLPGHRGAAHVPFNEDPLRAARSVETLQHASGQYVVTDESRNLPNRSVCLCQKIRIRA